MRLFNKLRQAVTTNRFKHVITNHGEKPLALGMFSWWAYCATSTVKNHLVLQVKQESQNQMNISKNNKI